MVLLFVLSILALTSYSQQFDFRNYSVGEGLAQSQVYALMEDNRGYIWMGTRGGGVSRFDGLRFRNYSVRDGLLNNYIQCLHEDAKGNVWIGTDVGLSKFNGTDFENFNLGFEVRCILPKDSSSLLLGTDNGIYTFDGKEAVMYATGDGDFSLPVNCLLKQGKFLWVATNAGLYRIADKEVGKRFTRQDGLNSNLIQSLELDAADNLWIGTYGGGLNIMSIGGLIDIDTEKKLKGKIIFSIDKTKDDIWLATYDGGVCRFNTKDSTFTYLDEGDGLANNHVRSIASDSWGNLWFGTSGGGVSKFYGQQFVHFSKGQGLPGGAIYSMTEDSEGKMWLGISDEGIARYDGDKFTVFNADSGFSNVKVKKVFEDKNCNLWLGTEGSGLARFDGDTFVFFGNFSGLSGNWIRDIIEDDKGDIWVATAGGGITVMTPNQKARRGYDFEYYVTGNGLPESRVNCLLLGRGNTVWFGTAGAGFGYIQGDGITSMTTQDGLVNNAIRSMTSTSGSLIWLGTGNGISRYNPKSDTAKFTNYTTKEGLYSNNIYLLQKDRDGNLWAGSESGLDKLTLDEDGNVIDIRHYGKSEGFAGIETCQNASFMDTKGALWFGTVNGLTRYNSGSDVKNEIPPRTRINGISLFYEALGETEYGKQVNSWGTLNGDLTLPYDQNHLSFDFTGINHRNPEKVFYQWRLDGFEEEWSPLTDKSSATYSNLPPGKFTFYLRSCNEDMVCANCPDVVQFTIEPPFWDTLWFRISGGGVLLLLVASVFKIRVDQVKRKTEHERRRLRMERDMLELEQKALRLQMNPHFIFNALNSIQSLIVKKDEQTARYFLAKFSKLMRGILENSREERITIAQEVKTLDNYLALEKFSRGDSFEFEITFSDEIESEEETIPPMMIQPFVENAIVHGIAHRQEGGRVVVQFEKEANYLKCTITDNGIGREQAALVKSQQEENHKSTALAVTQERLDILHAQSNGKKGLEVIDLKDEQDKAIGTRVVVVIPLG